MKDDRRERRENMLTNKYMEKNEKDNFIAINEVKERKKRPIKEKKLERKGKMEGRKKKTRKNTM